MDHGAHFTYSDFGNKIVLRGLTLFWIKFRYLAVDSQAGLGNHNRVCTIDSITRRKRREKT